MRKSLFSRCFTIELECNQ